MKEDRIQQPASFPSDRLFNWKEGNEITGLVSRYMEYKQWFSPITARRLEWEIKTRLPFTAKTHYDVMVWLDATFKC